MPRPRTKPLPRGVYQRIYPSGRVTFWVSFVDALGARVRELGGDSIAEAQRHLAQRERAVEHGELDEAGTDMQTLETYSKRWLALRAGEGVRTHEREAQLMKDWILPKLGSIRMRDLRPRDVARWVADQAGERAPKSILNTHGVLSAMLERARFDEVIVVNVNAAKGLPRGVLPLNVRSRDVGSWTRDEVARLISDERIPAERRVIYAIAAFTGARLGECAGMRWGDLDTLAGPLWRWPLRTQWDGQELKTERPRDVPIHPELRRILEAWKDGPWSRFACRIPRARDFVVPREDGTVHSRQSLGAKAVHRHAKLVGIDDSGRDFHSFRRFMVTHCRVDGARDLYLERVTHNRKGTQIDGYTYLEWPELCEAVACLKLEEPRGRAEVLEIPITTPIQVPAGAIGHTFGHTPADPGRVTLETKAVAGWRRRVSNPIAGAASDGSPRQTAAIEWIGPPPSRHRKHERGGDDERRAREQAGVPARVPHGRPRRRTDHLGR